jgi:cytidylate kinase
VAVITISRENGSLGNITARAVAARLGYRVVMRELINQAALRAGAPAVALAIIDELHLLGVTPSPEEYAAYTRAVQAVMEELAQAGDVVIVGRAGQVTLRGWAGVLHVRMIAPLELRARRLADRQHIAYAAGLAQARASDRERRAFLKRFYGVDWNDPRLYDLVINTERLSAETACAVICAAVEQARIETPGREENP